MAKVDLRKLKDSATDAFSKQKWGKAAELYRQIVAWEPNEPDWFQREGECWRKLDEPVAAVSAFQRAAEGYAKNGFLLKAIAVCKTILQLDGKHTLTQAMLAELYAKRDGGRAPVAPPRPGAVAPAVPPRAAPPPLAAAPPVAPVAPAPAPPPADPMLGRLEAIDLSELPAQAATGSRAALESVNLHRLLGGRQSQQFSAVAIDEVSGELVLPPTAYEIELGDEELEIVEVEVPTAAPPARLDAIDRLDDELDFSTVTSAAPPPSAAPAAPRLDDELDFSDVAEEADEAPAPVLERRALPRIPLFSSLSPERLQLVIESCELREVEAGTVVVREGEAGESLFVIVTGTARVESSASPEPLAELSEGQFFGELTLLTDSPRSASVVAATPLTVLEISRALIGRLIADEPEVLRTLLRFFRERMVDRWLKTSPLFATMSPDDARTLAGRWKLIELLPNIQAITAGRRAEGMFLLLCGRVRVVQAGAVIARLEAGSIFGELSLLNHQPAVASVETETKCWALCLERAIFQEIMVTYPQVLQYVSELAEKRQTVAVH